MTTLLGYSPSANATNCNLDALAVQAAAGYGAALAADAAAATATSAATAAASAASAATAAATAAATLAAGASTDAASALAAANTANTNASTALATATTSVGTATVASVDAAAALALATTASANATAALGSVTVVPSPVRGRTVATLQNYVNHNAVLHAADYGVVGDGTTNDTTAMQTALTASATYKMPLYCGSMIVKITAGLTMSGPGLIFDVCSYGNAGDPGILVTGTGYTALTITGQPSQVRACVYGTQNTANGVYMNNPLLGQVQKLRVYNLKGFGIQIDKCWDCTFLDLSVELCNPTGTTYSFSMQPAGDTCNMSHVGRLQVERCGTNNGRVIYVDGSTLSCLIENIHSEQATPSVGVDTWYLGGSRTQYNAGRFNASTPANATLKLAAGNAAYHALLVEGAIDVSVDAGSGNSTATLVGCEVQGTLHPTNGQAGTLVLVGGTVASLYDPKLGTGAVQPGLRAFGVLFASVTLGFQTNFDPTLAVFSNCQIAALAQTSTHASATFVGCLIGTAATAVFSWGGGMLAFHGSTIQGTGTLTVSSGELWLHQCAVSASVAWTNATPLRLFGTRISGGLAKGDAGNTNVLCDDGAWAGGTVTWNVAPSAGAHVIGERHKNLIPVVGNPKAWICTVAGSPGTWVSEGNL